MTVPVVLQHTQDGKLVVNKNIQIEDRQQKLYQLIKTTEKNEYKLGEVMDVHYDLFSLHDE